MNEHAMDRLCRYWIKCCTLFGLVLVLATATAIHAAPLRIGSWDQRTDPLTMGSEAVLSLAYAEAQLPVEFVNLPLRRAMSMMLNDELDGNLHRVAALALEQAGLVRVETPINATVVRAYTRSATFNPTSWQDLSGQRVAYRRGVLIIEKHLGSDVVRIEAKSEADAVRMAAVGVVA